MTVRTLVESLEQQPIPVLRAIAASHHLDVAQVSRRDLPRVLADHLKRPDVLARALDRLTSEERAVLDRLVAEGGLFPAHRLQREYGEVRELGPGRLERERPWEDPISPAERLWYMGFMYSDFGQVGRFRGRVFYIPADLLPLLPPVEAPPVRFEVEPVEPPATLLESAPDDVVEDAFVILSELQRHPAPLDEGGFLSIEVLRRMNARLRVPEPHLAEEPKLQRLGLILHLLRDLRLIVPERGHMVLAVSAVRRWLQAPRDRRLLSLQRAWARDPHWNDLWHVPGLAFEPTGWRNDPLTTRQQVLHWLKQVPPDTWISVDSFVKAIKRVDPDFQRPTGDYESWFIRDARTGEFLRGWESWDAVEGALLRYLLAGPLHWLGMVNLGLGADGEPAAFRLTLWGRRFLGHEVHVSPPPPKTPIRVAADGTIAIPEGADDWERLHVERLAVPVNPPTHYRLDRERIVSVLVEGSDPERVMRFLRQATGGQLPEPVERRIRGWMAGFGQVTVRRLVVLEVRDPAVLQTLRRDPRLRRWLGRPLNRHTVAVSPEHLDALIASLRRAGYLPRVVDEGGEGDLASSR